MIDTNGIRDVLFSGRMYESDCDDEKPDDGDPMEHYDNVILALCDEVDRLRAENDELKDALEYYANKNIWRKIETRTEHNTYIEYVWDWTRPPFERAQEVLDKFAEEL